MEFHGDEDWIDAEIQQQQQAYQDEHADDWKYENDRNED
jgi:hypothetical protein